MGYSELEIEVTLARADERRRLWVSALPGMRPGRKVRLGDDGRADDQHWWRVVEVGRIRLREASATLEMAN